MVIILGMIIVIIIIAVIEAMAMTIVLATMKPLMTAKLSNISFKDDYDQVNRDNCDTDICNVVDDGHDDWCEGHGDSQMTWHIQPSS